jgi:hypothetical protein
MLTRKLSIVFAALFLCVLCDVTAMAQGGWDVWSIYLKDGTQIDAAPVWSLDKEYLRYGMKGEIGVGQKIKRSDIVAMSRNVSATRSDPSVPKLPEGDVDTDLAVMADGTPVSGSILIRASKNPSGQVEHFAPVLVQDGKETDLRQFAHIKLAKPKS